MSSILNRFKDIMSANVNALLDKVEDPSKMIDQYTRNLESELGKIKSETAAIMAEEKRAKRALNECNESIAKMVSYAERALLSGNESDARAFLEKKAQLLEKQPSLEQSHKIAQDNSIKMRTVHDKIVDDINKLNSKRQELKAKMQVAKTQEKINDMSSNLDLSGESMSKFAKMEDKINQKLDEVDAMAELNKNKSEEDNIDDLMKKYDSENSSSSNTDDELAALKAKLGL